MLMKDSKKYPGIRSFSFLCWTLRIVGQKESTKSLIAASSDCFPSSSCILLREYWNLVPNDYNIHVKETKIWLPLKTWSSLSVSRFAAYREGNWSSWCLYCLRAATPVSTFLLCQECCAQFSQTTLQPAPGPRLWQIRRWSVHNFIVQNTCIASLLKDHVCVTKCIIIL